MRFMIAVVLAAGAGVDRPTPRQRQPILDMHMGPPPVAVCSPIPEMPVWDPAVPYPAVFGSRLKDCAAPIWSPRTDDEIMRQTIAVMERRNIIGVLSGGQDIERHHAM